MLWRCFLELILADLLDSFKLQMRKIIKVKIKMFSYLESVEDAVLFLGMETVSSSVSSSSSPVKSMKNLLVVFFRVVVIFFPLVILVLDLM